MNDGVLFALFAAIASRDDVSVLRMLGEAPDLANQWLRVGASRQDPRPYFRLFGFRRGLGCHWTTIELRTRQLGLPA